MGKMWKTIPNVVMPCPTSITVATKGLNKG
jgi:hypothetical protein